MNLLIVDSEVEGLNTTTTKLEKVAVYLLSEKIAKISFQLFSEDFSSLLPLPRYSSGVNNSLR